MIVDKVNVVPLEMNAGDAMKMAGSGGEAGFGDDAHHYQHTDTKA